MNVNLKEEFSQKNLTSSAFDEKFVIYMLGKLLLCLIFVEIEKRYTQLNRHEQIRVEQWVNLLSSVIFLVKKTMPSYFKSCMEKE
jgi:hypothetical protein